MVDKKMLSRLPLKVKKTLSVHKMVKAGDRVLLAVSGGADSIAMLHALNRLRDELGLELSVCHLNHNLRGRESERDFNFVKRTSEALGLGFYGRRLRKGELEEKGASLQEAARIKRYAFFEDVARLCGANRVALGHTLDDQAETVLMRFIKGSALRGLCGIPPVRGIFIRPLIETTREEVERFLEREGLEYIIDSSNLTTRYLRNDIRLRLIPYIKKGYNPNVIEALGRSSRLLCRDEEHLAKEAQKAFKDAVIRKEKGTFVMDRKKLLDLHPAVSARIFLKSVEDLGGPDLYSHHIDSFLEAVGSRSPSVSFVLPEGLRLSREYEKIVVSRWKPREAKPFEEILKVPGTTEVEGGWLLKASILRKPPERLERGESVAYFDYDEIRGPVRIRPMRPGDRMIPFGMRGHKKIKEIFIEKKVPRRQRSAVPILFYGDDALWAAGVRRSELFRVTASTKKVLKVELIK